MELVCLSVLLAGRCIDVNREFVHILFMCILFCESLLFFGCLSTSFSLLWTIRFPLGILWQPLDHFGSPWFAMEVTLVYLRRFSRFLVASIGSIKYAVPYVLPRVPLAQAPPHWPGSYSTGPGPGPGPPRSHPARVPGPGPDIYICIYLHITYSTYVYIYIYMHINICI